MKRMKLKEPWFLKTETIASITASILLIALFGLLLILSSCGGGGAGSADVSHGIGKTAINLSLYTDKMVTKTRNTITLQASLYDGNGKPLPDRDVHFDVISGSATLSSGLAKTDSKGIATVNLESTSTNSTVVVVKASSNNSQAQDSKTVYFVNTMTIQPSLYLIPDGDNDGVYGESSDYTIVADGEDIIELKAIYLDITEQPEAGRDIHFGSDSEEVSFSKNPAITDLEGSAYTAMTVSNFSGKQTITVYAHNYNSGAADIISINVIPVTAGSLYLTSSSYSVEVGQTADIRACVFSEAGSPMPDETIIRYIVSPYYMGSIEEIYGYTYDGCHKTVFTAGDKKGDVTITALSEGVSNSVKITITKAPTQLQVSPSSATTPVETPFTFIITGGTPPYIVTADTSSAIVSPSTVTQEGRTFTVTGSVAETVTITVIDAERQTASATLNVVEVEEE
jgi:hypothetical protein